MSYQNVSEAQLRMIYQRYRDTEAAFSRIYDELIEHPQTPADILEDIATNSRCPEYLTSKAKAALAKKKVEQTDALNSHAFGTFGTSPAEQALVPKASGSM
jgi:hypothetical protein